MNIANWATGDNAVGISFSLSWSHTPKKAAPRTSKMYLTMMLVIMSRPTSWSNFNAVQGALGLQVILVGGYKHVPASSTFFHVWVYALQATEKEPCYNKLLGCHCLGALPKRNCGCTKLRVTSLVPVRGGDFSEFN